MVIQGRNNYLAISDALLLVTMLSNNFNEALDNDASKVIDLIGKAFSFSNQEIEELKKLVCDDLTVISTTEDVKAFYSNNGYNDFPAIAELLHLKAEAILKIDNIKNIFNKNEDNQFLFDYQYLKPYYAEIRFNELENASSKGNVDINRCVAMMLALGIGVERNIDAAIYRFKQCAFWGDIPSLYYLAYLYKEKEDEKNAKMFANLVSLSIHLLEGITILPEKEKAKYDNETINNYVLIASIKQDIILYYKINEINFSFVELILLDTVDYYTKMKCINHYENQYYKEITNSSNDPNKRIGFKVKEEK